MVALRGVIVKKEEAEVEVSPEELEKIALKELSTFSIMLLARRSWLKSKGMGEDVQIKKNSEKYYWTEYENHGPHYSGYFSNNIPCSQEDKEKLEAFDALISKLR